MGGLVKGLPRIFKTMVSSMIKIMPWSAATSGSQIFSKMLLRTLRQPSYSGVISCKLSTAGSQLTQSDDSVIIDWRDSLEGRHKVLTSSKYHYIWLRDNCRCPKCYNPGLNQRFIDSLKALGSAIPTSLSLSSEGSEDKMTTMRVMWEDGHESHYSMEWLSKNVYDGSVDYKLNEEAPFTWDERQESHGWGQEIASSPPRMAYSDIMSSDEKFLEWCSLMERHGFVFVDETPLDLESVKRLVNRIGCVSTSYYGDYYESSADGSLYNDPSYTTKGEIKFHTDGVYMQAVPGLELFQSLRLKGPELPKNSLVDGAKFAEIIKKEDPFHYRILSSVSLPYYYKFEERTYISSHTPFLLEPKTGRFIRFTFNESHRMPINGHCMYLLKKAEPTATMTDLYAATNRLVRLIQDTSLRYDFVLDLGKCLIFDNHRLMHARSSYIGSRVLRSCWIAMEEWRAKILSTRRRLEQD